MNNPQQGSWPDKVPPIGTGEGESPLTKTTPPPFDMRTMNSDTKSVSNTGGSPTPKPYTPPEAPRPYIPPPPIRPTPPPTVSPPTPPPGMSAGFPPPQKPMPPAQGGFPPQSRPTPPPTQSSFPPSQKPSVPISSRDIFKPPQVETMGNATLKTTGPAAPTPPPMTSQKKGGKGVLIGVVVGIVVLGVVAYFVFPSLLSQPQIETPPETEQPPQTNTAPIQEPEPSPTPTPELETPIEATIPTHTSLFKTSAPETVGFDATPISPTTWKAIFDSETSASTPTLKEFVVSSGGQLLTLAGFADQIFPSALSQSVINSFVKEITVFSYSDANGVWPGFIAQYDTNGEIKTLGTAQTSLKDDLEKFAPSSLVPFYVSDPGTPQTWKQGQTGDIMNRYIIFSTQNSAISMNYGWLGDKLIVSTSYDGFKEAIKYLR